MPVADHAAKGGTARAKKLTPEARAASARAAARARWDRAKPDDPAPAPSAPSRDRANLPDIEFNDDIDVHLGSN